MRALPSLLVFLSQLLFAQVPQFKTGERSVLGLDKPLTTSLAAGDIDGDGDMDVVDWERPILD